MYGRRQLDGRTVEARHLAGMMHALATARGASTWADLPPALQVLARRISFKDLICSALEEYLLQNENAAESLNERYIRFANSLRADLMLYGLERVPKPVGQSLDDLRRAIEEDDDDETE